jgi:hypothetical protein
MATYSREATFTGANRPHTLRLTVNTTNDASNNRTNFSFSLQIIPNVNWSSWSFNANPWSVSIDGQNFGGNFTYDWRNNKNTITIGTGSGRINHNSDGSKRARFTGSATGSSIGSASVDWSENLTTYPRAPNPPSSVTADAPVGRSIRITFPAASGGAGVSNYDIDRIENNTSWVRVNSGTTSRDLTYTGLNPRSTYRFRVRANGPGGSSGFRESNSQTIAPAATTPTTTATRTRRNVSVVISEPSSLIDGSTTITSYTTQRRQNNGPWGDERTTTDRANRTITYSDLPSETNQQFRGRVNTNFGSSDFSESQVIFIPGLPDPPSEIMVMRLGADVQVILVAGADGGAPVLTYTLEKRISDDFGDTWSEWGDQIIVPFSESIYLYQDLELQKTYQFRALATNEEGNSEGFTESPSIYLPAIVRIYDSEQGQFRLPNNFKRYDEEIGDWVGLSISRRYFSGEWVELE